MELSHPKNLKIFRVKELLNLNKLQFKSQKSIGRILRASIRKYPILV